MEEELLLIPGPTNLSMKVRQAMAGPQLPHVGKEFYVTFKEIVGLARYVFRNEKGVQLVFTGSGTIGMEASVVSTVSRGDETLTLVNGYFGRRMLMINQIHGAKADSIEYKDGAHSDPDDLRKKLNSQKYKAVFMTHIDTSTSVCNPIRELVEECNKAGVLSIVDSVCGVGGAPLDFDRLGADIAFTASQKAIAGAPGAVMIATSQKIMEHFEKRKDPIESYYLNLLRWKPIMDDPRMYLATPATQVLLALKQALLDVKDEGLENRWARHRSLGELTRATIESLGLDLVADAGFRADTVTSFWTMGDKAGEVQKRLEDEFNIMIARGISESKDKMNRIGHFGILTVPTLKDALSKISRVIVEVGGARNRAVAS